MKSQLDTSLILRSTSVARTETVRETAYRQGICASAKKGCVIIWDCFDAHETVGRVAVIVRFLVCRVWRKMQI